jgi:hypothetical protein
MQKTFIAVLVTAIVMLGSAAAHGQGDVWQTGTNGGVPWTLSNTHYTTVGAVRGVSINFGNRDEQTIENLYSAGGTFGNNFGGLTIVNLYATTDVLSPAPASASMPSNFRNRHAGINVAVQNFWLQVGNRNLYVDGTDREFGSVPHVTSITLNQDGITSSIGDVHWYSSGWLGNADFGVKVASNGTVSDLTMSGGKVNNAGTITNLMVGGGTYNGTGTVGNLKFESNGGVFTIAGWSSDDDFGFMNAGTVDLANATGLAVNLVGMLGDFDVSRGVDAWTSAFFGTFGDDALSLEKIFGTESIEHSDAVNFFSIDWGNGDDMISWTTEHGWSGIGTGARVWAFGDAGVTVSLATVPEPATLVIIGLGLAGLGYARRQRII